MDDTAWRLTEHTADIGIEARAATRETVFADAATALSAVITGTRDPRLFVPTTEMAVDVQAPDEAALVVAWLSELLWHLESEDLLWTTGGVEIGAGVPDGLRLTARGNAVRYDPGRHGRGTEVKAVTYHDLVIARDGPEWVLRVLLDI